MVNLLRGVFITCDIPMKQFILKLDEDQAPNRFVIANLDETHLFIQSWALKFVQDKLEELYEENYYQPEY